MTTPSAPTKRLLARGCSAPAGWLLVVLLAGAAGGPSCKSVPLPDDRPINDLEASRDHAISIAASGYIFWGDEVRNVSWQGTGVWVAPGLAATSVLTALRANHLEGRGIGARTFVFERVVALDLDKGLALLRTKTSIEPPPMTYLDKPGDPAELTGQRVFAAGGDLASHHGEIRKVVKVEEAEFVLHNAVVPAQAVGGPLFLSRDFRLAGITCLAIPGATDSLATPSWQLAAAAAEAESKPGIEPGVLFNNEDLPVTELRSGRECLGRGEKLEMPFSITGEVDLVFDVSPEQPGKWFDIGLRDPAGTLIVRRGGVRSIRHVYTIDKTGAFTLLLGHTSNEARNHCYQVRIGQVAWQDRFQQRH